MYINVAFILTLMNLNTTAMQRSDFLDNCEWCVKQSRSTQPLDIGEWYTRCQQVPKPIWFNHRQLGRCYGTGKQLTKQNWLYTIKYGWVYIVPTNPGYYYKYKTGWIYVVNNATYCFATKRWLEYNE